MSLEQETEYTEPLVWAEAKVCMTVKLRHEKYLAVVGKITAGSGEVGFVYVNGAGYQRDWSLWVRPVSAEDNALFMLAKTIHLGFMGSNEDDVWDKEDLDVAHAVRAAGYMTEAEWETKRVRAELPDLTNLLADLAELAYENLGRAHWHTVTQASQAIRDLLASAPEGSNP